MIGERRIVGRHGAGRLIELPVANQTVELCDLDIDQPTVVETNVIQGTMELLAIPAHAGGNPQLILSRVGVSYVPARGSE